MDVAVVCVSAYLELQDVQTCSKINVVLGAVGPTPLSAGKATDILCRAPVTEDLIEQAADLAVEEALPIDDVRASAWYRRKLVKVLTFRAILAAYDQARHSFEDS